MKRIGNASIVNPSVCKNLTDMEISRLLQECEIKTNSNGSIAKGSPPPYLKTIVLTALNTGLRKSIILELRWEQIDWQNNEIIHSNQTRGFMSRKYTHVPMTKVLREALIQWRNRSNVPKISGLVFPSPKNQGQKLTSRSLGFDAVVKKAGLNGLKFHDLRHTFIVRFVKESGLLLETGVMVGASPDYMQKHYANLLKKRPLNTSKICD